MLGRLFLRRTLQYGRQELFEFFEALCSLTVAFMVIKMLPFRSVIRTMSYWRNARPISPAETRSVANDVQRAVKRAARRLPWAIVCFPEGLAAHWMLRRRGLESQLHYGLRPSVEKLSAHVWVTLGEEVIVGEEAEDPHHCVAVFPQHPS